MDSVIFSSISAIVGVGGLVFAGITLMRSSSDKDSAVSATLARLETTIGSIESGISELKIDLKANQQNLDDFKTYVRHEINEVSKTAIAAHSSAKAAHKRLDMAGIGSSYCASDDQDA